MSLIAELAGQAKPILTTLLMPPAGGLFLIVLGILFATRQRLSLRRLGISVQLLGVALLWVLSCHGAAVWLGAKLLPQPEVPTMVINSPAFTLMFIRSNTTLLPYFFQRFLAVINGV